jgi:hypothetical protein
MSIPIIGQNTPTAPAETLHTLTPEQEEALARMAEDNPPTDDEIDPGIPVTTAFLVVIGTDGAVVSTHDLSADFRPQRQATPDDMFGACAVVQKDIQVMETAQRTQMQMLQMGQAMQAKAEESAIRHRLQLPHNGI